MTLSIAVNILTLFGFKYFSMFSNSLAAISGFAGLDFQIPELKFIIPAGISFFTFKKISYIVDVYKEERVAERHFGHFALYVGHFLEIVAGPIDRSNHLLPQIKSGRTACWATFNSGAMLLILGLFMKVVIADRIAVYTNPIFNNVTHHNGPSLVLAAYFYSFQIYADFAGYTNIALGCGRMIGYEFQPNFNLPYFSKSISEFWRRWHMTLSYWFRDYVYIPMGGNRVSQFRRFINLSVVFLLCGLWHGANWTFVVWGALHGVYLIIALMTKGIRISFWDRIRLPVKVKNGIKVFITFNLVTFSWIFFRSNSLNDACVFLQRISKNWPHLFIDNNTVGHSLMVIAALVTCEYAIYSNRINLSKWQKLPAPLKWISAYVIVFLIILAGVNSDSAFIYYQF
jgi:D-alanyl-lipoteichoic acid acyltransferase DltB (MBOAT superfamily)